MFYNNRLNNFYQNLFYNTPSTLLRYNHSCDKIGSRTEFYNLYFRLELIRCIDYGYDSTGQYGPKHQIMGITNYIGSSITGTRLYMTSTLISFKSKSSIRYHEYIHYAYSLSTGFTNTVIINPISYRSSLVYASPSRISIPI